MTSLPAWLGANRTLSMYVIQAALHVASVLDEPASRKADARESYWHHATGGRYSPMDLRIGERLLVDIGLVVEIGETLRPTRSMYDLLDGTIEDATTILSLKALALVYESHPVDGNPDMELLRDSVSELIPDAARREEALLALSARFDDAHRRIIGAIGEDLVVSTARNELLNLGYPELARGVRHVSLQSDQLGYDVSAPRVSGAARLLEVKSSASSGEEITVYISRHEFETGKKYDDWSLVVCRVTDVTAREGEILGWCSTSMLEALMPMDSEIGRWEIGSVPLLTSMLVPGLPRPG